MAAMTRSEHLFDRLAADLDHRLSRPSTRPATARWADNLPPLAGCRSAADVAHLAAEGPLRPLVLGHLIHRSAIDELAAETAYRALLGDLRMVARRLTRAWRGRPGEVDQAVAAAGWEAVARFAGRRLEDPERTVVGAARTAVRDGLRREALHAGRTRPVAEFEPVPEPDPDFDTAADLIRDAVRRGVITPGSAELVWTTRVVGVPAVDLAGRSGQRTNRLVMRRLRAERALRRDRVTCAAWGRAS